MNLTNPLALTALSLFLALPTAGRAQVTRADYERADALRARGRDTVFKARVRPHWSADGKGLWYRNDLPGGAREYVVVDAVKGVRRAAFDHAKVAAALEEATGKPQAADTLDVDKLDPEDGGAVRFEAGGTFWRFDPATGELTPSEPRPAAPAAHGPTSRPRESRRGAGSPDHTRSAAIKDHNVVLTGKAGGERVVTTEGTESDGYEPGVYWSPDSSRFVALRTARGDDRRVNLIASSPRDQLQPKLDSYHYLKPGDRVPVTRPHLFDAENGKEIPVADDLFRNPWEVDRVHWAADSSRFSFLYNERGHQVLRVVSVDSKTGAARAAVEDRSKTFIDYSNKTFLEWLDGDRELLWTSERDGWNHLYRVDATTGSVVNRVTTGEWVVRGVDRVDHGKRRVWFRAVGVRPGQDPYFVHFARVDFDGAGLVVLTAGDGTHEIDGWPNLSEYYIDTYSRVDLPPVTELRRSADGSLVCVLERADVSALGAKGWKPPGRFVAKGRDGGTDIYGVIYRPTRFDAGKKYPVIEHIYAGPQGAFVPKRFAAFHSPEALAELGFVVVQVDGMGTNWRSKAFHDVCWKDLADAGFPDRIAWLKAAAEKHPEMDLSRVGVYGGSAGGQNALGALLFHGDFYKAAAADCGCHDNRMDKIWWNEQWMGWPVGPHYRAQSNAVNAHKLTGKLLLTVGELDRNVDPASTMQVVDALIRAGKDFELVVFPGGGHGSGGSPYGTRRLRDFFVRNLLGCAPPDWNGGNRPD